MLAKVVCNCAKWTRESYETSSCFNVLGSCTFLVLSYNLCFICFFCLWYNKVFFFVVYIFLIECRLVVIERFVVYIFHHFVVSRGMT